MTVEEMLARIGSRELTEWQAYEKAFGLLDDGYVAETLAGILDKLQHIGYLLGAQLAQNSADDAANPVPPPEPWPRPAQVFQERPSRAGKRKKPKAETVAGADELNAYFDVIESV